MIKGLNSLFYGNFNGLNKDLSNGLFKGNYNSPLLLDPDVLKWSYSLQIFPSYNYLRDLSILVQDLKYYGIWYILDRLWIFATEQQQHATICIKTLNKLIEVANPRWTMLQGYTGDGVASYLNSNYIMSTHGVNYTQNNASMGVYSRTNILQNTVDIGSFDSAGSKRAYMYLRRINGTNDWSISALNSNADNSGVKITSTDSRGFFSISRTNSTVFSTHRNGSILGTSTVSSNALTTVNNYILALNVAGSPSSKSSRQLSMAYFGSGNINQLNFYNLFQKFAINQGFAV